MKSLSPLYFVIATVVPSCAQTLSPQEIFSKVSPSVVTVYTLKQSQVYSSDQNVLAGQNEQYAQGSGVILNDSGWVVTNYHVFEGGDKIILKQGSTVFNHISVIGTDVRKDLLMLKIESDCCPAGAVSMGTSDSLSVGDNIYAVGSPLGLENSLSTGIISGLRHGDERDERRWIQITAPISHGSSGGAVVNDRGQLIGISARTLRGGQNLNFAIPVEEVLSITIEDYTDKVKLEIINLNRIADEAYYDSDHIRSMHYYRKVLNSTQ